MEQIKDLLERTFSSLAPLDVAVAARLAQQPVAALEPIGPEVERIP